MKLSIYLCSVLMALAIFSCQQNQEVAPLAETALTCGFEGKVMNNDCGLYIAVSNGQKIYVDSPKKFSLKEGETVQVAYYRASNNSLDEGVCTDCGSDSDESGGEGAIEDPTTNMGEKEACMYHEGVALAVITCIESKTSSQGSD